MADLNYKGLFQAWEVAVAKNLVYEFQGKWRCLDIDDFEDLLQECLIHWLFVKDRYDPKAEASEKTYMGRVVRNKLNDIVKDHDRLCRRGSQNAVSLDKPLFDEENSPTLLDAMAENKDRVSDLWLHTELRIDLSHAYQKLTPAQKKLCDLLGDEGLSINEASEILKKPRGTVYEEINRIKAIFRKERLYEYLE